MSNRIVINQRSAKLSQTRWARTGGGGGDFARRHKSAREKSGRVYPDHSSEYTQDVRSYGMKHGEDYKFEHFYDEKGGVDLFHYAWHRASKRVSTRIDGRDIFIKSQKDSYEQLSRLLKTRDAETIAMGRYRRWKPIFLSVKGFRHVDPKMKFTDSKKKKQLPEPEQPKYEEVTERVVTKIPNPYQILSLPRDATLKHAAANYRRLAKKYHPDSVNGSVDRMAELNTSYAVVKKIIKEGGPEKSSTAAECDQHNVEEKIYKTKRKVKTAKGTHTVEEVEDLVDQHEMKFTRHEEEMNEMRVMSSNFKKSIRAKDRRKYLKQERLEMYSKNALPPTEARLGSGQMWELFIAVSLVAAAIATVIPDDNIANVVYSKDDPLSPPIRL